MTFTLKAPFTTAADGIYKYFFIVRFRIHTKKQALFSSKDKRRNLKCRLLQFLLGALGLTQILFTNKMSMNFQMMLFTCSLMRGVWRPLFCALRVTVAEVLKGVGRV